MKFILQALLFVMDTLSLAQLQQFLSSNNISRVNDMLLFEGIVDFNGDDGAYTINSDVQIIMLPKSAALYILEFLEEDYGQNEMFSTSDHQFKCIENKTLQINSDTATIRISIPSSPWSIKNT